MFLRTWQPTRSSVTGERLFKASLKARLRGAGLVLLVHGYGEHLGRYGHVACYFAGRGYVVVGADKEANE